ncbi:SGNH/GDSL hydrolase family protein [Paenibacillus typhae]|uniref:SGNH/GDSL hydrolase family protein n=1 Tax=Paenibacillus typhae TaxID=1174501 RepID=UPI001C8E963C|nr:SGNH/GDSL hydrolase family protein [Paenibacillus typhae]MBY0011781.1 GDSL family lipase [Paenibacillus typhae]
MRLLSLTDAWFHGAVSLEHLEGGIKPWRIPYLDYGLYPPGGIEGKAEICAGVRLRLRTDSAEVAVSFAPLAEDAAMDCVAGGALLWTLHLPAGATEAHFGGLPGDTKDIEIWLPQNTGMTVTGLRISAGAFGVPLPDDRPRWVTYGSSITQCVAASSPSRTWPAIAAEACGFNLTSLGFSGNCHMEPMIGRMIRDLPADFISICAGVNIYGAATLSPRMFKPLLIGLLETIRDGHKETPLLVITPIYGTIRETELNPLGFTLPMMREAIRETVKLLRERGDRYLYCRDGLDWLGAEEEAFLTDGLHPGAEGYELMGRRFPGLLEGVYRTADR